MENSLMQILIILYKFCWRLTLQFSIEITEYSDRPMAEFEQQLTWHRDEHRCEDHASAHLVWKRLKTSSLA